MIEMFHIIVYPFCSKPTHPFSQTMPNYPFGLTTIEFYAFQDLTAMLTSFSFLPVQSPLEHAGCIALLLRALYFFIFILFRSL